MRPYKIFLEYTNATKLEEDLLQSKIIHPVFREYLYFKYLKKIKKLLTWTKKENPLVRFKIINNSSLLLHNGRFVNNYLDGSQICHDDLRHWLVDECETREDRIITI